MRVNVSAINLYQRCPQRWYNRYVLLREPPPSSVAMQAGTIFHQGMEGYLHLRKAGENHPEALGWSLRFFDKEIRESGDVKLKRELVGVRDNFAFYPGPTYYDPKRILLVEEDMELPIGDGIVLVGRPDAVVEDDHFVYHLQHKAMMLSLSLSAYKESMRLSPHELAYKRMIERRFPGKRYGGTISNILKKGGIPGIDKLDEDIIPLSETDANDFIDRARVIGLEMQERIRNMNTGGVMPRNGDACFSMNSLCPYHKVCLGKMSLADPKFIDVPEAYPKKGDA